MLTARCADLPPDRKRLPLKNHQNFTNPTGTTGASPSMVTTDTNQPDAGSAATAP
jgi:hypothetical protein